MDKKEFSLFCSALRTYYPRENILPNSQAMELWYAELKDIPYPIAETGLRKWVATEKWSPAICDIRAMCSGISEGEQKEWGEAWEDAMRAIAKYGWYNAEDALNSMDELTRRTVKCIGFRELCLSENIDVERANFRMVYETMKKRDKQERQMPLALRDRIQAIQNGNVLLLKDLN